jgi:ABC-2 type transport system permease protein
MRSVTAHIKFETVQAMRIPMVYVGLLFLPSVGMLLYVIPSLGHDPRTAALSTASMCLFTVLTICSAQYGTGIADARMKPWGGYVRTLPGGPLPKVIGMITLSVILSVCGSLPMIAIAALGTDASVSFGRLLLGVLALALAVVPFGLLTITIGYAVNPYLVHVLATIAPMALAYLAGYFADPDATSGFVAHVAPFNPVRGPAELVWAAVGGHPVDPVSMVMLAVWTVLFAFLARRAYRADEGQRFR